MAIKKVLVTGSEGYIGTVLVPLLLSKGYDVIGLDAAYFGVHNPAHPNFTFIQEDVRQTDRISLEGVDAIVHLAALSNDPMGELNKQLTTDINYEASVALAKKAKQNKVQRFLFSSSCSIYGIAESGVVTETSPTNPLTEYAKSKIGVETALQALADEDFCVGLLRNSTVYGASPNLRLDLVVNNLTASAVATGEIKILSDGSPWRPLIDVRDLSAIFAAFLAAEAEKINGIIFNSGFNESNYRVKDVAEAVKAHLPACNLVFTHEHGSDTRSYRVSFDKLHTTLPGIIQQWPISKSIADLIRHLQAQHYSLKDWEAKTMIRLVHLNQLQASHQLDDNLYWR